MHLRSTQGNLRNDRNSRNRRTNTIGWGSQLSGNIDWNKCISCYSLATGAISDDKISWDQYTPCSLGSVLGNTTLGTVFLDTLDTKKHCKNCKTALFKVWIVENVFCRQMIYKTLTDDWCQHHILSHHKIITCWENGRRPMVAHSLESGSGPDGNPRVLDYSIEWSSSNNLHLFCPNIQKSSNDKWKLPKIFYLFCVNNFQD